VIIIPKKTASMKGFLKAVGFPVKFVLKNFHLRKTFSDNIV
jgi:hypothetical protein